MKTVFSIICAASLALSGCVAFPELPNGPSVDISKIVENIECDIQNSLETKFTNHFWLLGWATDIKLQLETENKGAGAGEVGINVPLMPETFALTISGGPTKNGKSSGDFTYNKRLIDIFKRPCARFESNQRSSVLSGRTGAGDWLTRVAYNTASSNACPSQINFTLTFKITLDGNGEPKISGIKLGDRTFSIGLKGTGQSNGQHQITLTATPVKKPEPTKDKSISVETKNKYQELMNEIIAIVFEKTGVRIKSDAIEECKILENGTLVGGAPSMIDAATQRALQESSSQFLLQQIINSNND